MSTEPANATQSWLNPGAWLKPNRRRPVMFAGAVVVAALLGIAFFKPEQVEPFRTEAVKQTTLTRSISATGTLQAVQSVQIGSQLSGQVKQVLVDFNDTVKKGQVLAIIDTENPENQVRESQAGLASAQASLATAQADYERQQRLAAADLVADKTAQDAQATLARARASVQQAQAQLASAQATLQRAEIRSPIDGIVINRTVDPGNTVAASFNTPNLFVIADDLSQMKIRILVDEADIGGVLANQKVTFTVDAYPDDEFEAVVQEVRKQPVVTSNVTSYEVMAIAPNPQRKLLPGMTCNAEIITEEYPDVTAIPMAATRWRPPNAAPATPAAGPQQGAGPQVAAAGGGQGFGGQRGPGAGQGAGQGGGQGRGPGGGPNPVEQVTAQLDLDAAQKEQVDKLVAAQREQRRAQFQNAAAGGGDRAAMGAAMRRANEQLFTDIEAVLRPEQKTKLAALRAEMGQRGAGGPNAQPRVERTVYVLRNGKPEAVSIMTGPNDGTWMAIYGDGLKAGDEVVTGGGAPVRAAAQNAGPNRPGGFGGGGFGGGGFGRGG